MGRLRLSCLLIAMLWITRVLCMGQETSAPKFNTAGAGAKTEDIEAALGVICKAKDITRSKDGKVSGCRTCPGGTDFHGEAGSNWEMYAETPGHFTSAQDDNLILDGTGCDSHANNFGGSYLFRIKDGKAILARYNPGLITDQCHKFSYSDGRDFLICRGGWSGQGEVDENVFMSAFDSVGKGMSTTLISTSEMADGCGDDPKEVVHESQIKDIQFVPKDSPQITGLTVIATLGDVKCSGKPGKPAGSAKAYPIEFLFDGKRFTAAPASRAALRLFQSN
jgi:hypothetical protein